MADKITSAMPNTDGSWTFGFTFDNGSGVLGTTSITLSAPTPTVDGNGNPVDAVPYTAETAKAPVLPIALATKNNWLATLSTASIIGDVAL